MLFMNGTLHSVQNWLLIWQNFFYPTLKNGHVLQYCILHKLNSWHVPYLCTKYLHKKIWPCLSSFVLIIVSDNVHQKLSCSCGKSESYAYWENKTYRYWYSFAMHACEKRNASPNKILEACRQIPIIKVSKINWEQSFQKKFEKLQHFTHG